MIPVRGITLDGTVSKVHDGDTLTITTQFSFNLRLKQANGTGCYAPELKGATKQQAIASRDHLASLALGKPVRVFIPTEGMKTLGDLTSLSRVLGDAWVVDGNTKKSLAQLQVESGHAQPKKTK